MCTPIYIYINLILASKILFLNILMFLTTCLSICLLLQSTESIDAAIGDVLSKPWLPLPLGLKSPSVDGVLVELQKQGVPKVPPACG